MKTFSLYSYIFESRSTSNPHIGQEIVSHIITPDFLPPEPTGMRLAWIFMGAPGPGASMHVRYLYQYLRMYVPVYGCIV